MTLVRRIHHVRLSTLYLCSNLFFAAVSAIAWAVSRLEYFAADRRVLSPDVFGDVSNLSMVLLGSLVVPTLIPAGIGFRLLPHSVGLSELKLPRLATLSWLLHLAGGCSILWAFVFGGLEPAWSVAVADPTQYASVSSVFLGGLFLAGLAVMLVGAVLLATVHHRSRGEVTPFVRGLALASWLLEVAMPVLLCALTLAWLERTFALGMFDPRRGGNATLLPLLTALVSSPIRAAALLPVLGLAAGVLDAERTMPIAGRRAFNRYMTAAALLGVLAVDGGVWFQEVYPVVAFEGAFAQALLTAVVLTLVTLLVRTSWVARAPLGPAQVYVGLALALVVVFMPIRLFLDTAPASLWSASYIGQASDQALWVWNVLLVAIGGLHAVKRVSQTPRRAFSLICAAVVAAGMVMTFTPMLVMGSAGLHMELAVYPVEYLPFQVLMTYGGALLSLGLAAASFDVALSTATN